jgi:hypothetical protein
MPVYKIHGFRWPRGGIPSVRVYIVLQNLEEAAAEYIQQKKTSRLILDSFKKNHPEAMKHLPDLQLLEAYDPDDLGHDTVSQPYAYVADSVTILPDSARPTQGLSKSIDQHQLDHFISPEAWSALAELRDEIAPEQNIGWWIIYNGDPERYYPGIEEENLGRDSFTSNGLPPVSDSPVSV